MNEVLKFHPEYFEIQTNQCQYKGCIRENSTCRTLSAVVCTIQLGRTPQLMKQREKTVTTRSRVKHQTKKNVFTL